MDEWIKEMKRILADLLQCGFSSVRQETLDRLKAVSYTHLGAGSGRVPGARAVYVGKDS